MTSDPRVAGNHARFPYAAERITHLRSLFGPGVKLLHATQAGDEIGERQPVGVVASQTCPVPDIAAHNGSDAENRGRLPATWRARRAQRTG